MDQLKEFSNNQNYDDTTKLRLTYSMLKGYMSGRVKRARPTIHRYLNGFVKSQFIQVSANEWESALFLPVDTLRTCNIVFMSKLFFKPNIIASEVAVIETADKKLFKSFIICPCPGVLPT